MSGRKEKSSKLALRHTIWLLCILLSSQSSDSFSVLTDTKIQNEDLSSKSDVLQNLSIILLRQVTNQETLIRYLMSKSGNNVNNDIPAMKKTLTEIQTELVIIKEEKKQLQEQVLKHKIQNAEYKNTLERHENLITKIEEHTEKLKEHFKNETQDLILRLKEQEDLIDAQSKRLIEQDKVNKNLEDMISELKERQQNKTQKLFIPLKEQDDLIDAQSKQQKEQDMVNQKLETMIRELKEGHQNETQKLIIRSKKPEPEIKKKFIDCADILRNKPGKKLHNDVYTIYFKDSPKLVFCDMTTEGGGWTVIQKNNLTLDFDRNWDEYKNGFGNASGEYWIGNEEIHFLTTENSQELRIDLEKDSGSKRFASDLEKDSGSKGFAKYSTFKVDSEMNKYRLTIGGYTGNADTHVSMDRFGNMMQETLQVGYHNVLMLLNKERDAFKGFNKSRFILNGMNFTTYDNDNDKYSANCATQWKGGWWYNSCFHLLLNSKERLQWYSPQWDFAILKASQMMIRPKQQN